MGRRDGPTTYCSFTAVYHKRMTDVPLDTSIFVCLFSHVSIFGVVLLASSKKVVSRVLVNLVLSHWESNESLPFSNQTFLLII